MKHSLKPPTITDVARSAGVSIGTVSRVLNGYTNITQANFDRVQQAIKELGYEKCRSAEQLVSRRNGRLAKTGNIGIIYANMSDAWMSHPLVSAYSIGVERACREAGFHALIEFWGGHDGLPRCVREGKVEGLLIKASRCEPSFLKDVPDTVPIVSMGLDRPGSHIQQVAPDNRGGGWAVTEYLWELGHRRIAFVCNDRVHPMFLARFQAYEEFMRSKHAFSLALCALSDLDASGKTPEATPPDMSNVARELLSGEGRDITAIIATNDWIAHGLYSALAEMKLSIPNDISIVGFDNTISICTSLRPQLTSYAIPFGEVGYVAAQKLFERINNPSSVWDKSLHLIRGDVVERASVKRLKTP
ncbi:MAG: LacI family DNA-binding transcriptional regulator [Chthoniobacteraceae bacterium]